MTPSKDPNRQERFLLFPPHHDSPNIASNRPQKTEYFSNKAKFVYIFLFLGT